MAEFPEEHALPKPPLQLMAAHRALREGRSIDAMQRYIAAARSEPSLAHLIAPNLDLLRRRYLRNRAAAARKHVGVCGWDLAHNAAGRVYTLAELHARCADVEIVGCFFSNRGTELWAPLRQVKLPPVHTIQVEDEANFLTLATDLVATHPYDIVHLSKPRMPNIFIGLLYRKLWGARVIMDVDDEELSFVDHHTDEISNVHLPPLKQAGALDGAAWTNYAVSMIPEFNAVTVANTALQARYGGTVVPHARDETKFAPPSAAERVAARRALILPQDRAIILFLGTVRRHKGVTRLAEALAATGRKDVALVIVGDLADAQAVSALKNMKGIECLLRPMVRIDEVPRMLAAADYCVFLQDPSSLTARYQTPAKLIDALAMGVPVAVFNNAAVADIVTAGAAVALPEQELVSGLKEFLDTWQGKRNERATEYFKAKFSTRVVSRQLDVLCGAPRLAANSTPISQDFVSSLRSTERLTLALLTRGRALIDYQRKINNDERWYEEGGVSS